MSKRPESSTRTPRAIKVDTKSYVPIGTYDPSRNITSGSASVVIETRLIRRLSRRISSGF